MSELKRQLITITLFGSLKSLSPEESFDLEVPQEATVAELRKTLKAKLLSFTPDANLSLLEASAVGTDERVLSENDLISNACVLSILPPVCGG